MEEKREGGREEEREGGRKEYGLRNVVRGCQGKVSMVFVCLPVPWGEKSSISNRLLLPITIL